MQLSDKRQAALEALRNGGKITVLLEEKPEHKGKVLPGSLRREFTSERELIATEWAVSRKKSMVKIIDYQID